MNEHELEPCITHYLEVCERQRRLNSKTVRAYRTDLRQLTDSLGKQPLGRETLAAYIAGLNRDCKPRTVKRKLASVKAFYIEPRLSIYRCIAVPKNKEMTEAQSCLADLMWAQELRGSGGADSSEE